MEIADRRDREKRRYEDIINRIRTLMIEGRLSPGDKLLPERQLAEMLGVSRGSVREALTVLQTMGVIEVSPGGGAYVRQVRFSDLIQSFAFVAFKEYQAVVDLLEVRKVLEVEAVALATSRAQPSDLTRILEDVVRFNRDVEAGLMPDESDSDFHAHIAEATENKVLASLMSMLSGLYRETYGPTRMRLVAAAGRAYAQDHRLIYEAMKRSDVDQACLAMAAHLDRIISGFRELEKESQQPTIQAID
ncbi:MAG TPA: FadR/GntR family transcriptional regulator [Bacillota bacterium]